MEMVELRASRGILTDPRSIAEYEKSCPGLGMKICDQFFTQTAKEQDHRHAMEKQMMDADVAQTARLLAQGDRAQKYGLFLVIIGLGIAVFLGFKEQYTACSATVGVVLGSTVAGFIYGRKKQAEEVIAGSKEATPPVAQSTTVEKARSEHPVTPTPKS